MLNDVTVQNQKQDFDYEGGGRVVPGIRTTFMVGKDGPFSVFLADADFTPTANLALIEKKADMVRAVRTHDGLKQA